LICGENIKKSNFSFFADSSPPANPQLNPAPPGLKAQEFSQAREPGLLWWAIAKSVGGNY
jgi:hypothetical protein